MNITDKRLIGYNGELLIVEREIIIDIGNDYSIKYSRLVTDHPDEIWMTFCYSGIEIYDLDGNRYYHFDGEKHITKEEFLDEISQNHHPLFEWILWNQLP